MDGWDVKEEQFRGRGEVMGKNISSMVWRLAFASLTDVAATTPSRLGGASMFVLMVLCCVRGKRNVIAG